MSGATSPEARFALYMPKEMPQPTPAAATFRYADSPSAGTESVPEVDRRHLYIWAWEYRQADRVRQTFRDRSSSKRVTQLTELSHFY